jgi:hypothetical protein
MRREGREDCAILVDTRRLMKAPESVCYFETIRCTRISWGVNFNVSLYRFLNSKLKPTCCAISGFYFSRASSQSSVPLTVAAELFC